MSAPNRGIGDTKMLLFFNIHYGYFTSHSDMPGKNHTWKQNVHFQYTIKASLFEKPDDGVLRLNNKHKYYRQC